MKNKSPNPSALLRNATPDYQYPGMVYGEWYYNENRKPFYLFRDVPAMLLDPRIRIALGYIKGTILSMARFFVDEGTDDAANPSEIKQFVIKQISRWWRNSVVKQMSAIEWGYSGCEVMYRVVGGQVEFDHLKLIHQQDIRAVTLDGCLAGMRIEHNSGAGKVYLGGPKAIWHVHEREHHPWYGKSRLHAAFDAWNELHCKGGGRDARRLYFYRYAFSGHTLYHPPGASQDETGAWVPNVDIAKRMLAALRSGGDITLPNQATPSTPNKEWELVSTPRDEASQGVIDYVNELKTELAEGLGVPEEVIQAADSGSGRAGRAVPETAFRGMLSDPVTWLIADFNEQVLEPLVRLRFGVSEVPYEIIPFGLVRNDDEETPEQSSQRPGDKKIPDKAANDAKLSIAV